MVLMFIFFIVFGLLKRVSFVPEQGGERVFPKEKAVTPFLFSSKKKEDRLMKENEFPPEAIKIKENSDRFSL